MMNASGSHKPTEEFRSALEWDISRALRREERICRGSHRIARQRLMLAARLVVTLAIGAFVGTAPAQIQNSQQRDALVAAEQAAERIAVARVTMAEESMRVVTVKFQLGAVAHDAVAAAEMELRAMQSKLATVHLNLEEIQASSAAPRDDLAAPIVGQRDFVKERLQQSMGSAQAVLTAREQEFAEAGRRQRVGSISTAELEESRTGLVEARSQMEILAGKLALRETFVKEHTAPADVERRTQILELRQELAVAQQKSVLAEKRLQLAHVRVSSGMITRQDELKAELELLELTSDIQKMTLRLKLLERGGDNS